MTVIFTVTFIWLITEEMGPLMIYFRKIKIIINPPNALLKLLIRFDTYFFHPLPYMVEKMFFCGKLNRLTQI